MPKLTEEKVDNLNRSIFMKEIKLITNYLPKHQDQMGSLANPAKYLSKKIYQFSIIFSGI